MFLVSLRGIVRYAPVPIYHHYYWQSLTMWTNDPSCLFFHSNPVVDGVVVYSLCYRCCCCWQVALVQHRVALLLRQSESKTETMNRNRSLVEVTFTFKISIITYILGRMGHSNCCIISCRVRYPGLKADVDTACTGGGSGGGRRGWSPSNRPRNVGLVHYLSNIVF